METVSFPQGLADELLQLQLDYGAINTTVRNGESLLIISAYTIGNEPWLTLIEWDIGSKSWSTVNIVGDAGVTLFQRMKELGLVPIFYKRDKK